MLLLSNNFTLLSHWRQPILSFTAALTILFLLYYDTVASTASIWLRSDTYAHGMFVIPFSLYMVWTKRQTLARLNIIHSWWGAVLLLISVVFWLLGNAMNVLLVQQIALLCMVWSVTLGVFGWLIVRSIMFPLVFLFFAIPLGEGLIPVLMDITAVFTVKALVLTGLPVYSDGHLFFLPSGSFEVAKGCSGVRYLFASVTLCSLFAYINFHSYKKRLLFILLSIILPILANGLRAYGVVLIAHYSEMKYATGFDHILYGWLFFGMIMFLLFYMGSKWHEEAPAKHTAVDDYGAEASKVRLSAPILLVIIVAMGPIAKGWMQAEYNEIEKVDFHAPQNVGQWNRMENEMSSFWNIDFKGPSYEMKTVYYFMQQQIQLYLGCYVSESQDAELINQTNHFYDVRRWAESQRDEKTLIVEGNMVRLHEKILLSGEKTRIFWYWYDLNGFITSNTYIAKLVQTRNRLTGNEHCDAVVALMADVKDDRDKTIENLQHFVNDMYPAIQTNLAEVRRKR